MEVSPPGSSTRTQRTNGARGQPPPKPERAGVEDEHEGVVFVQCLASRGGDIDHGAAVWGANDDGLDRLPGLRALFAGKQLFSCVSGQERKGVQVLIYMELCPRAKQVLPSSGLPKFVSSDRCFQGGSSSLRMLALGLEKLLDDKRVGAFVQLPQVIESLETRAGQVKGSSKLGLALGEPGVGRLRFLFGASLAAVSREQLLLRFTKLR